MKIITTRSRVLLISVFSTCSLICIYLMMFSKNIDFSTLRKPDFSDFDELKQRHRDGYFDNIQLKDLLRHTRFVSSPEHVCKRIPRMVTLVQSGCTHHEHRRAIRETWGQTCKKLNIPVVFFVGKCPSSKHEQDRFEDMVEVDFADSYYNNTLKSLARFRWFLKECRDADFLFMADDDTAVMIDLLLDFVTPGIGYSMIGHLYGGRVEVVRDKDSRWYIPKWSYRAPYYPPYLGGWAYVVNGSAVQDLYEASLEVGFITVDDALFTGIAAQFAGISRLTDVRRFPKNKNLAVACGDSSIFATQFLSPAMIRSYFESRLRKCAV